MEEEIEAMNSDDTSAQTAYNLDWQKRRREKV